MERSGASAGTPASVVPRVVGFWFGEPGSEEFGQEREIWWKPDPRFDAEVGRALGDDYEAAAAGRLDALRTTSEGCLALVLLLDQVPRNLFRGKPRAFATDAEAVGLADHTVARGLDRALPPFQRAFVYLPFEHAEDMALQERSVALFRDLGIRNQLDYAVRHRDIIARFGRFPHRNTILGRPSTEEERDFLKAPGSSF